MNSDDKRVPSGWSHAGSAPHEYEMVLDSTTRHDGHPAVVVQALAGNPSGFGTLMQTILPDDFRGKRVRLSAWMKSENVAHRAALWMRVDGPAKPLAFDDMLQRPIKGTCEWRLQEVVLDVADAAVAVAFGVLLEGSGAVWISEVDLMVVAKEVPTTEETLPRRPRNLRFEE